MKKVYYCYYYNNFHNVKLLLVSSLKGLVYVGLESDFLIIKNKYDIEFNEEINLIYIQYLDYYFNNKNNNLNISFDINISNFSQKVYNIVCSISFGEFKTYKEIAILLGGVNYSRAVAKSLATNPLLIFIPCHRVIGTSNVIRGYKGGLNLLNILHNFERLRKITDDK